MPTIDWRPAHGWVLLAFVPASPRPRSTAGGRIARQMRDGRPRRVWPVALAADRRPACSRSAPRSASAWTVSWPELRGFNFAGGTTLSPEYVALLLALTTYTAAFIAEIVGAGILSVSQGQWEAAQALGLRRGA